MALWQDGNVVTEDGKLHYYRTGGQKPPILLLHGFLDNGLCWTRVAEALESEYDVIMPDARGHGNSSDYPPIKFSLKEMAIDLIKIIQKLGLKTPILLGHSMGAFVAAYTAASVPPLVGKIILEDPEWDDKSLNTTKEDRMAKAEATRNRVRGWKSQTPQQLVTEYRRSQPVNWHKTEYATWSDAKLLVSPNATGYISADPVPLTDIVSKIICPALLITGDPQEGAYIDTADSQKIITANPRIQVAQIAGAGHDVHRDKFDPYMQAVKQFLGNS